VFGLSIIKHVTLQKIVAHDFRYGPRTYRTGKVYKPVYYLSDVNSPFFKIKMAAFSVKITVLKSGIPNKNYKIYLCNLTKNKVTI